MPAIPSEEPYGTYGSPEASNDGIVLSSECNPLFLIPQQEQQQWRASLGGTPLTKCRSSQSPAWVGHPSPGAAALRGQLWWGVPQQEQKQ